MSPRTPLALLADLGSNVAAWSGTVDGRTVVVVNRLAMTLRKGPLYEQALDVLKSHGIPLTRIQEVVDGICSRPLA